MRSRYTAFVKKDIAYLHRTLHPSHDEGGTDLATFTRSMRKHFGQGFVYTKLEVLGVRDEDVEGISKVLFVANDGSSGNELWLSVGTGAGTLLVADLNPGAADGAPPGIEAVVLGNRLLFAADDGQTGV